MIYKFCRLMGFASLIKGDGITISDGRKCDEASHGEMAGLIHSYHVRHDVCFVFYS